MNPDGTIRRELRPEDEVFHPESLKSLEMIPLTNGHPPVPGDLLNATNARDFTVGVVGENIRRDGDHVAGHAVIYDKSTIDDAEHGKVQLSPGYECRVDETSGVHPKYGAYNVVQRDIRYNHMAVVPTARQGDTIRIRMDASIQVASAAGNQPNKEDVMDLTQALAALAAAQKDLGAATARADAAEGKIKELTTQVAQVQARADQAEADLKKEKQARTDAATQLPAQIKARLKLEATAERFLGSDVKFVRTDGSPKTDREIKAEVLTRLDATIDLKDKADAYVDARFDIALENAVESEKVLGDVRREVDGPAARTDTGDARTKMIHANQNAWKRTPAA